MFTGLVEKTALVTAVRPGGTVRLSIDLEEIAEGVKPGDSIAVNGACLTVSGLSGTVATFDVVAESMRRTSLGDLEPGDRANVERALRVGDRLGGHFVQGHVDGVGTISGRTRRGGEYLLHISAPSFLTDQMVEKGSVAIDGVSLTIASLTSGSLTIAIVPHTLAHTTLDAKPDGSRVNIETDLIGKYVRKLAMQGRNEGLTEDFLREHGF